jgi:hypothetical protein
MGDQHDEVRGRAYAIWEAEGRPEGRDFDHWLRAEREGVAAIPAPDGPVPEGAAGESLPVDGPLASEAEDALPEDGPMSSEADDALPEDGPMSSAEAGVERVLEAGEAQDPEVTGAGELARSD